jgi:uncharacterized protein YjbI with pentapeptide repeats
MYLKPMTHDVRLRIKEYQKSGMDISSLISGKEIKGEDFSRCLISSLDVPETDISGCNFTGATMRINAQGAKARDCKFIRCKILPDSCFRGCDLRGSNFYEADCGFVDYAYADLRGANICGAQFSFASKLGYKAKLSPNVIDLIKKWWDISDGEPMQMNRPDTEK